MPSSGGGFEQSYNAQAAVDTATMRVITAHVTQAPNDKRETAPVLDKVQALPRALGYISRLLADTGYGSQANVQACPGHEIEPMLSMKRVMGWRQMRMRGLDKARGEWSLVTKAPGRPSDASGAAHRSSPPRQDRKTDPPQSRPAGPGRFSVPSDVAGSLWGAIPGLVGALAGTETRTGAGPNPSPSPTAS